MPVHKINKHWVHDSEERERGMEVLRGPQTISVMFTS